MEPTIASNVVAQRMEEVKALFAKHNQEHVFQWADTLTDSERLTFLEDLGQIDVANINKIYKDTVAYEGIFMTRVHFLRSSAYLTFNTEIAKTKKVELQPFPNVTKFSDASKEQRARWEQIGHTLIADNKVAILLLAGGQASRLGCTFPKGMYGITLGFCIFFFFFFSSSNLSLP